MPIMRKTSLLMSFSSPSNNFDTMLLPERIHGNCQAVFGGREHEKVKLGQSSGANRPPACIRLLEIEEGFKKSELHL